METPADAEANAENNTKEILVEKNSSSLTSLKHIAAPVVYKLVRVEGDGRLVPATDDELMAVEDLLEDNKGELPLVEERRYTKGCISSDGFLQKAGLEGSEDLPRLSQTENMGVDARKLNARLEYIEGMLQKVKQEERLRLSCESLDNSLKCMNVDGPSSDMHNQLPTSNDKAHAENPSLETMPPNCSRLNNGDAMQIASVEMCLEPNDRQVVEESSVSNARSSSKPDFSTIKGEICLDNLSIRELHETFRATFGRETSVKDKLWLKRRIAMGLTNSCDVSTTNFLIKNKTLICKNEKEVECRVENSKSADGSQSGDEIIGAINDGSKDSVTSSMNGKEELVFSGKRLRNLETECDTKSKIEDGDKGECSHEQIGSKRARKPTRRYIEELSEVETRECSGRPVPFKNSGHGHSSAQLQVRPIGTVDSVGTAVITRQDSIGGSGIQIPYVSRVRRGRPREDFMALMKYHPSGVAAKLVERALGIHVSQQDGESGSKIGALPKQIPQPTVIETEKENPAIVTYTGEEQADQEPEKSDSRDNSDDNIVTAPTSKGGTRRKHHRAWTLSEVMKLVEGVSRYGAGRWSEIKRLAFASYTYRTSVDLKDKWRNLLRASLSQAPSDQGARSSSRKHASIPIPAHIFVRVRELAEMHSQVASEQSSSNWAGRSVRSVNESRSGYL